MVDAGQPTNTVLPTVETALRHLGARTRGELEELLAFAADRPEGTTGQALVPLLRPTEGLADWTSNERADAILRLIEEGVYHPTVGPTSQSRRRRALQAAFRLPDPAIAEEWGASLKERFKQLQQLRSVFGEVYSTQPMEMAWKRGVVSLGVYLDRRFRELTTPESWEPYRRRPVTPPEDPAVRLSGIDRQLGDDDVSYRPPSTGAQPLFVEMLVTTVQMRGRMVRRRVTERVVTARGEEPVPFYAARGFRERTASPHESEKRLAPVPLTALWGCHDELVVTGRGWPLTRLWFPEPLQPGAQAYFASEAEFDATPDSGDDVEWIDVDIDHHGIPPGRLLYGGRVPVRGLTIRILFDPASLPQAVWWYAEANEDERYDEPLPDDPHLLPIIENAVTHTFTEPCQPREHYGIALAWPVDDQLPEPSSNDGQRQTDDGARRSATASRS